MTAMKVGQQVRLTQHVSGWPPGTEGTIGVIVPGPLGAGLPADYVVDIPGPESAGPDGRYASVYVRGDQLEPINDQDGAA